MPALPLGDAGRYVAMAYVVLLALLALYIGIMARKVARAERRMSELDELRRDVEAVKAARELEEAEDGLAEGREERSQQIV